MCCIFCGFALSQSPGQLSAQPVAAQRDSMERDNHSVEFRINDSDITASGRDVLNSVNAHVDSLLHVDALKGIAVTGAASLDGPADFNSRLALARARSVRDYILNRPALKSPGALHHSFSTSISSKGEDWEMFRRLVVEDKALPQRADVIRIIDSNLSKDLKEKQLRALPQAWPYLCDYILPRTRRADILITWLNSDPIVESVAFESTPEISPEVTQTIIPENTDSLPETETSVPEIVPLEPESRTRHYYIKTNLPAWLFLWTNIAGEADIVPHLSADLSIYYSGFNYFKQRLKFRTFTVMPEIRFWPKPSNDGLFFGAHFGLCYYNIATLGDYRYQDHNGTTPAIGGGITAGYRLPLRNPRWKMEFSLGAGIYKLDYDIFKNETNGMLTGRRKRTFYGIDRAAVSLCYTFGTSAKKGGGK